MESIENRLAVEVLLRIASYLNDKDLAHFGQGNKFLRLILSEILFKRSMEDQPPRVVKVPALVWAINYGHANVVQRIVSQRNFSMNHVRIRSALHQAAAVGNCRIISILLAAGYDVNDVFADKTPLHESALNAHPDAVQLLLDRGADITAEHIEHTTALTLAIASAWPVFEKLQKEAFDTQSYFDEIQVKYAVERRVVSTIRILVENGALVELSSSNWVGDTPLHQAVYGCLHSEGGSDLRVGTGVIRYLVEQGANLSLRNNDQERPIDVAAGFTHGSKTALNCFLDMGESPNSLDSSGNTLLSQALVCVAAALPIVELLLSRGATIDSRALWNFFHDSDDHDAVVFDKLLTLLIIHGATFGDERSECFTFAAHNGMFEIMKVVFEVGIDINTAVCKNGSEEPMTPLQIAINKKHHDMLAFLVQKGAKMTEQQEVEIAEILGGPASPSV